LFRFPDENVQWIAEHFLGNEDEETRGGALSSVMKMKILLRYVADSGIKNKVIQSIVTYLRGWSTAPASVGEQFVYCGGPLTKNIGRHEFGLQ
jgi:hypothetical protein